MPKLILRQKVSALTLFKRKVLNWVSKIVYKLYKMYEYNSVKGYDFAEPELDKETLFQAENYVNDGSILDYKREIQNSNIDKLSQYYPYARIEKEHQSKGTDLQLKICNVGCFYAGADALFLQRHPQSHILGLDFGDIEGFNSDLKVPNLKFVSGYPLHSLKALAEKPDPEIFDYVIFVRTAVKINIEQLLTYMKYISMISENVIFLEFAKLRTSHLRKVDVAAIDMMAPMKLYGGLYLHNYMAVLEKFGYEVIESEVIPPNIFEHNLTPDHDFVYVRGTKKITKK